MKRIIPKIMFFCLGFAALAFVSCSDNENGTPENPFFSELIGSYVPTYVEMPTEGGSVNQFYLQVSPTWKDPNNIPTVDMSFMMGFPPGSFMMPVSDALPFVEAIVSNFVKNGLVGLELKNDGTFGVQYRSVTFSDDILQDLLKGPKFSDEIFLFPSPETEQLIPTGALSYYTEKGQLYIALSKTFLNSVGGDLQLTQIIDDLVKQYKLNIVSTEEIYAIPLKYSVKESVVTIYVDREMMLPFVPLIKELAPMLPGPDQTGGIDLVTFIPDVLDKLFDNTSSLEIKIFIKKK